MEQNVKACSESILRIKKILDSLGIDNINVDNGLLVKVSSNYTTKIIPTANLQQNPNCTCIKNNTSVDITKECPYKTDCNVQITDCPLHNVNCTYMGSTIGSTSNAKLNAKYDSLFRIRPSDIQNGINLYAVILHGESCDLKLLFQSNQNGETELINTLKFLI